MESIDVQSKLFRRLRGDDAVLAQALALRMSTARGTLWTDRSYGLPLAEYVNLGLSTGDAARLPYEIKAQLELDARVESAAVEVLRAQDTPAGYALAFQAEITPVDGDTFAALFATDGVGVELLSGGGD